MHIGRLRLKGGDLALRLRALLKLRHLLPLHGRCRDLLTKNDVSDLAGRQRGDVHAVTLAEVLQAMIRYAVINTTLTSLTAKIRSFNATSTLIHSSSDKDGQTK